MRARSRPSFWGEVVDIAEIRGREVEDTGYAEKPERARDVCGRLFTTRHVEIQLQVSTGNTSPSCHLKYIEFAYHAPLTHFSVQRSTPAVQLSGHTTKARQSSFPNENHQEGFVTVPMLAVSIE